jgi:hypothetical protein
MILEILNSLLQSLLYVIADSYFWPSMAVIVMIGLFIGSTIYDGCVKEVRKMMLSLFIYALMIITVTSERVLPDIFEGKFLAHHPFSGVCTVFLVTLFYAIGMIVGTSITKHAHHGREL